MNDAHRLHVPSVPIPVEDAGQVRARARGRVRIVGLLLGACLTATTARGVQLALEPDDRTLSIAADNRWAAVSTQGPRGEITDVNGHVLAMSVRSPAVFADPGAMRERGLDVSRIARDLSELLDVPVEELERRLNGKGRYVRLSAGVTPESAAELTRRGLTRARGIIVEENYRRYYPQGQLAAHLIGFVDDDGGISGLEREYNELLSGASIVSSARVNRFGALVDPSQGRERAIQGMRIHTTLDRTIQRSLERALEQTMATFEPVSASGVVVEVSTGRVLAMASAPTFNPNRLREGDINRTRNLAVGDAVEPGSVIKPLTLAAAYETGVTSPGERLLTPSPLVVSGVKLRDDHPRKSHTTESMIKYSSNIAAAMLAARLGQKRMDEYLRAFGLGEVTGVPTFGETRGSRHPRRFGPVELATVSYGQGMTASPIQLAMAIATIGNDGVRMKPLLVTKVEDASGRTVQVYDTTVERQVVSAETARAVARAMSTVFDEGGTATEAAVPGYRAAGKTGTALKVKNGAYSKTARYATFVGFAPLDNPDIAMAIVVDEPTRVSRYGGTVAGPVFSTVMSESLQHRGVPMDPNLMPSEDEDTDLPVVPEPYAPVEVAWVGDGWTMPELHGRSMRDALAGLQGLGVHLDIGGSGLLTGQDPAPGTVLRPGDTVALRFQ